MCWQFVVAICVLPFLRLRSRSCAGISVLSPHPVLFPLPLFLLSQLDGFSERRSNLLRLTHSTSYEKQKCSLVVDFVAFLESNANLPLPERTSPTPMEATPEDIVKFLYYRDSRGRTQVHRVTCEHLGLRGSFPCGCPVRLAAGTIDSMVGKLRAFFNALGRPNLYSPGDSSGNPCASPLVKDWMKATFAEQRRARVTPHQAPPIFSFHLRFLASEIRRRQSTASSEPFLPNRFALERDLAFFLVQWFSGDRAGDLGNSLGKEVTRLECGSLLFNHTIGKTIRQSDGDLVVVPAIPEEPDLCPVRAVDAYVRFCRENGLDVVNGYLFRPLEPRARRSVLSTPFSSSSATKRLRLYLRDAPFDSSSLTAHGFRAGCAITLLLLDCSPEDVKTHCRWASDRVFSHYTKLGKVSQLETSAAALRQGVSSEGGQSAADAKAEFYSLLNSGQQQSPAFAAPLSSS